MKIYLDMDGVCADFMRGANIACGRSPNEVWTEYDHWSSWGMTLDELWANIDHTQEAFWRKLDEYPWFWNLVTLCGKLGEVWFCTTPSQSPCSAAGKLLWLQDRFGKDFRRWILTPDKSHLAAADRLLIDDHPSNCSSFEQAGGKALLWPMPWNGLCCGIRRIDMMDTMKALSK